MVRRCCVVNCNETDLSILSHRFPKPQAIASKWRDSLGIEEISPTDLQKGSFVVCTKHFRGADYRNEVSNCLNTTAIPNLNDNSENNERIVTTKSKEKSKHLSQLKWHKDTPKIEKRKVFVAEISNEVKQTPSRVAQIIRELPAKKIKLEKNFENQSHVTVKNQPVDLITVTQFEASEDYKPMEIQEFNSIENDEQPMPSHDIDFVMEDCEEQISHEDDQGLNRINFNQQCSPHNLPAHSKIKPIVINKKVAENIKKEFLNSVKISRVNHNQISQAHNKISQGNNQRSSNVAKKILKDAETQVENNQSEKDFQCRLNDLTSLEDIKKSPLVFEDQSTMTESTQKSHQEVQVNLEAPTTAAPTDKDDKMIKLLYPKYAGLSKMELVKILVERDLKIASLEEKEKQLEEILTKMI